jgi:hypothetical protein
MEAGAAPFITPNTAAEHAQNLRCKDLVYLSIMSHDVLAGFIILALSGASSDASSDASSGDGYSVEFRRVVLETKEVGTGQPAICLMEHYCENVLKRSRVWLDVFEDNLRGRHIYEKSGYRETDRTTHGGRVLLVLEKSL